MKKNKKQKKTTCLLLMCFWTCGIPITLSHFMCCRLDPCPPIKVICGLECNCNVKNKSAQQSMSCLVTGRFVFFSFSVLEERCCWQHLFNDTGRGLNNKSLLIWVNLRSKLSNCHQLLKTIYTCDVISGFTLNSLSYFQFWRKLQAHFKHRMLHEFRSQ